MVGVGAICDRPQSYRISFRANAVRPYVSFCLSLREGQDPPLRAMGWRLDAGGMKKALVYVILSEVRSTKSKNLGTIDSA